MNLDDNQKKFLLIGGVVLLSFYLISKWLNEKPKSDENDSKANALDKEKILKKGSQGDEVAELQRVLKEKYNANLGKSGIKEDGIDGDFGLLTQVALKKAKNVIEISLKNL